MTRTHATRYITLLSFVLALALTAALAACGSDEPSGVTGPDRTASTPGPAAATALTFGPTSAETDREALVAIYKATDGENWATSDNWLSDAPLYAWAGVTAKSGGQSGGRVTELDLNDNELSGEIPPELGSLSNLEVLELNYNELSGEIPPWLGSLSNLAVLDLSGNPLHGGIPAELGSLSNLIVLDLNFTALGGEIPAELGSLSNLTYLSLSGRGEIPAELGSLSNLEGLNLSYNAFSGEIPAELGSLPNLETLDLYDNDLSGEIPPELGRLSNLRELNLGGNDLSGCVPSSLKDQLYAHSDLGNLPFC